MEVAKKIENISHSLLADQVLTSIRVTNPLGKTTLRGRVISLNVFTIPNSSIPKWVYGTLLGEDASIDFKCHPASAPKFVGEYVILEGTLDTSVNRFKSGLKVVLSGNVVGEWNPQNNNHYIHLEKTNGRIYLLDFLKQNDIKSLKILTTQVGFNDLISAFNKKMLDKDITIDHKIGKFDDTNALIQTAKEAVLDKNIKAIAFVRGGKGDKSMEIWNDNLFVAALLELGIPYYTAIGHTDPIYLAEKYSDEAFNNPNDFGYALGETLSNLTSDNDKKNQIKALGYRANKSEEAISRLSRTHKINISSVKKWLYISFFLNIALVYLYFW